MTKSVECMYQLDNPCQLLDCKWQNDVLWGLRLTIGNNIDHVLTKRAYKPLGSFGCMRVILGTFQEIVQDEAD